MKTAKLLMSLSIVMIFTACADAEFGTLSNKTLEDDCNVLGTCPPEVVDNNVTENRRLGKTLGEVDILIVNDNSPSMRSEQKKMSERFPSFISGLEGISWQIGMTTTDTRSSNGLKGSLDQIKGAADGKRSITHLDTNAEDLFINNIQRKDRGATSTEEPLKASILAMEKSRTDNLGFFRENANLAVVIMSDEDERSSGGSRATKPQAVIDAFKEQFDSRKKLSVYALIIKPGDQECFDKQRSGSNQIYYGTHAQDLSDLTGGITGSICDDDYAQTLKSISESVGSTVRSIELGFKPIPETVKVSITPAQEFNWELQGQKVVFDRALKEGTEVEIKYEKDSKVVVIGE